MSFVLYKKFINNELFRISMSVIKKQGLVVFLKKSVKRVLFKDLDYIRWVKRNTLTHEEVAIQKKRKFTYSPKISIVVPLYNTPIKYLKEMIDSVYSQTYSNWELCLTDASDDMVDRYKVLKDLYFLDDRILYKKLEKNFGISINTNKGIDIASGSYIAFLDHDDILSIDALYEVICALQADRYDFIYSDEDFISDNLKKRFSPVFKPDWSPDLICSHNYITHFTVINKELMDKVKGLNKKYDGAQDYDLVLRCSEVDAKFHHIPKILYHWRVCKNSVASNSNNKIFAYEAGKSALEDYYKRRKLNVDVSMMSQKGFYTSNYILNVQPLVSIIIPNKDNIYYLDKCIKSLFNNNLYKNFEVIICENNSTNNKTFDYYEKINSKYKNIKVYAYKGDFNYSAINNFSFQFALGEYVLFLNNDTEIIEEYSLVNMVGVCSKSENGIVGSKLLYKDRTIQHAGVVVGIGGSAGHVFSGLKEDSLGYMLRPIINCNYSAVTGACLMIKSKVFKEVGGFDEKFPLAFNDVDLCLKVRSKGYYIAYVANSIWFHYESKTRGYNDSEKKIKQFRKDKNNLVAKWNFYYPNNDPFYNINFPIDCYPYTLAKIFNGELYD